MDKQERKRPLGRLTRGINITGTGAAICTVVVVARYNDT
jgi:hypothetical protein